VKALVAQTEQTRYVAQTLSDATSATFVNFNSQVVVSEDWYKAIPDITTGPDANQRLGNKVHPIKCYVDFEFRYSKADELTRDIMVVFFLLTSKDQKQYDGTAVNGVLRDQYDKYLRSDGNNLDYYDGTWEHSTFPINKEHFSVLKHKQFRLTKASGNRDGSGVIGQYDGNGRGMYSTPAGYRRTMRIPIKCPTLKYDKASDHIANNFAPMWAVGYYYCDGTAADTAGGVLAVSARTHMWFKSE